MTTLIGITSWTDLNEEVFEAIKNHALRKAKETIRWEKAIRINPPNEVGFQIADNNVEIYHQALSFIFGESNVYFDYFVPYLFNTDFCEDIPPPSTFWYDRIYLKSTNEIKTVVSAPVLLTRWRGDYDAHYRKRATENAALFSLEFLHQITNYTDLSEENYQILFHHYEVSLINSLAKGVEKFLPVVFYP